MTANDTVSLPPPPSSDAPAGRPHPAWGKRLLWLSIFAAIVISQALKAWNSTVFSVFDGYSGAALLYDILYWLVVIPAAMPALAVVGMLVTAHRPRNPIGWICLGLASAMAIQDGAWQYAFHTVELDPGSLLGGLLAGWVAQVTGPLFGPPSFPLALLFLFFPSGQLVSARWRWVLWLTLVGLSLGVVLAILAPQVYVGYETVLGNPTSSTWLAANPTLIENLFWFQEILGLVVLVLALFSLFIRWRASNMIGRQQLKWLLYTALVATLFLAVSVWLQSGREESTYSAVITFCIGAFVITVGIPATIGMAVLRYRLWDIDLLIRRSLIWGALTAFVIGSYVLIVGYLGSLLHTQNNTALSLAAAGFVAIGFHPLRERLQRGVNRLFYGQRDEPYAVITQLGEKLQAIISPDAVLPTIAHTLQTALKSPYVAVALTQPDGSYVIRAAVGEAQLTDLTLPLTFNNNEVGQLQIAARQRDEAFDTVDQRFITEFAQSAAAAVHAVRLTNDLQQARQRLVNLREEERRRLRRDLHDGLGPALASISMQTDAVRNLLPATPDPDLSLAREMLGDVTTQAQTTMQSVRQLIHGLRPPALDDLGLIAALRSLANDLGAGKLSLTVTTPDCLPPLSAAVEVAVYRITQEALTNVVKHAQASRCEVRLSLQQERLSLTITDNGQGLPSERRAGVGLASMRERAEELGGSWAMQSAVGGGTQIVLQLPLAGDR